MQAQYFDHPPMQAEFYAPTDYQSHVPYLAPAEYPLFDPAIFSHHLQPSLPPLTIPQYQDQSVPGLASVPPYGTDPYANVQHAVAVSPQNHSPTYIHSPIPVSAYSTLLPHVDKMSAESSPASPQAPLSTPPPFAPLLSHPAEHLVQEPQFFMHSSRIEHDGAKPCNPLQRYDAPQVMFPTPSELLTDLTQRDVDVEPIPQPEMCTSAPHSFGAGIGGASLPDAASAPSATFSARSTAQIPTAVQPVQPGKPENLRKSYFRTVANSVGFQPTDPDTITSHDKKRHYLECMEHYIVWVHEQIRLAGHTPLQMERVDTYRGLNSRSIRTMLVHMQNQTRKLHMQVADGEAKYFGLERQMRSHSVDPMEGDAVPPLPTISIERTRRHSIANGMIPLLSGSYMPPILPPPPTLRPHGQ